MESAKPFGISKREVWEAYKRVRATHGAAGVAEQSRAEFEEDLPNNLYKLWNRRASGSYCPPPVRRVELPKDKGGVRELGIPMVPSYCTSIQAAWGSPLFLSGPGQSDAF
jgi:RNA-directed DNA polymerase